MSDIARHGATQPDEVRHTLTIRDVETLLADAGVQRSHRHVMRMCQTGMLDASKFPGGPSGDEWRIAPASVPKAIGDLKQIDELRARRSASQPAASNHVMAEEGRIIEADIARHSAPQHAASETENKDDSSPTQPAIARRGAPEQDIYEHPYVKKLEDRVEKLEAKYEAQVRRTEDIQLKGQAQLLELQRMTAVGQSQTLADFMLKARNLVFRAPTDAEEKEDVAAPTA
jgi:hypothetical protein